MSDFTAAIGALAALAHIELDPEEEKYLAGQLREILEAAARVQELDTRGVDPAEGLLSTEQLFRDDEVKASMPAEDVLRMAPRSRDGCIEVPRLLRRSAEEL